MQKMCLAKSATQSCVLQHCAFIGVNQLNQFAVNQYHLTCHKHNYIPCSMSTITKVQLHVSAINVGHLKVVHEALNDKLYLHVSLQFVGWGRCEVSFCVCRRGVDRVCLGGVVKISFISTNSYVYK